MLAQLLAFGIALWLLRRWLAIQDVPNNHSPEQKSSSSSSSGSTKSKNNKKKKKGGSSGSNNTVDGSSEHDSLTTAAFIGPKSKDKVKNVTESSAASAKMPTNETTVNAADEVEKAKSKIVKGAPMPVDSDSDEEHPQGDILVIKLPGPRPKTLRDYANDPAEDGWERVTPNKALKSNPSGAAATSIKHYQPIQEPTQSTDENLTAKQRANKRKAEKQKAEKDTLRMLQEERLRKHRKAQEKEMIWKPPPPKYIPKDNQWESTTTPTEKSTNTDAVDQDGFW